MQLLTQPFLKNYAFLFLGYRQEAFGGKLLCCCGKAIVVVGAVALAFNPRLQGKVSLSVFKHFFVSFY
jgi:hypothetical protein